MKKLIVPAPVILLFTGISHAQMTQKQPVKNKTDYNQQSNHNQ